MGCWGMGITQSDEYCEVYDRFMEEYDGGKGVADITKDLLAEYLEEFEPDDGVLHDVYFALGKAEWMCGGISDAILERIRQIVETDENIRFYRELEATEKDLNARRKNLQKFLSGLSVPRGKTRKRKIPEEKYVPPVPDLLADVLPGNVYACEHNGRFRLFGVSERSRWCDRQRLAVYCYAWEKSLDKLPSVWQLQEEPMQPLGWFFAETFPPMEKLTLVGNLPLLKSLGDTFPNIICPDWRPAVWALAKEEDLTEAVPSYTALTPDEALEILRQRRAANGIETQPER